MDCILKDRVRRGSRLLTTAPAKRVLLYLGGETITEPADSNTVLQKEVKLEITLLTAKCFFRAIKLGDFT